jgi:hypothetical protein
MLQSLTVLGSVVWILLVLFDGFESMVLPRRVTHRYRYTRFFFHFTWKFWKTVALRFPAGPAREAFLSVYGPLALLSLIASWMAGLVVGFGALHWSLATALHGADPEPSFLNYVYLSGTTLFTLGYGDITPTGDTGRVLAVIESGMGLASLAVVVGYLPVLYQASSRREVSISLLDARAGSPPTAAQFLLRLARTGNISVANPFLEEWERWSAEILESQLSYPVLSYYRSQHINQSWLAALTAVLDSCALLVAGVDGNDPYQAQLTFAMARHAAVDLVLIFKLQPRSPETDRLPEDRLTLLRGQLRKAGMALREGPEVNARLNELRGTYEPFVNALSQHLLFALPPVLAEEVVADNWQRSAWVPRPPGIGSLPPPPVEDHFD